MGSILGLQGTIGGLKRDYRGQMGDYRGQIAPTGGELSRFAEFFLYNSQSNFNIFIY